jgi:glycine dehydrogenase
MGPGGLTRATQVAILNANYVARRLDAHFPILYRGRDGLVAHECICDLRAYRKSAGVEVDDVAKRLMDFGFHAPTVHFPVPGTVMIEPTESESKAELDRFCDAMAAIRGEIADIEAGRADRLDNPLKNAPHTAQDAADDDWRHPYTRRQAVWPAPWLAEHKHWPAVGRIDNAFGDRQLVCACPPPMAEEEAEHGR